MKHLINLTLFSLALVFFGQSSVSAQLYNCQGKWTNTPCKDGSEPIEGMPEISRAGSHTIGDAKKLSEVQLEEAEVSPAESECKVATGGLDIRVQSIDVQKEIDRALNTETTYFNLLIKNYSSKPLTSGLRVKYYRSGGEPLYKQIPSTIPANGIKTAQFQTTSTKSQPYYIELLYSPAAKCRRVKTNSGAARIFDSDRRKGASGKLVDQASFVNNVKRDLKLLEKDIRQAKHEFRRLSRNDTPKVTAYQRFSNRYRKICTKEAGQSNKVVSMCKNVLEDIENFIYG